MGSNSAFTTPAIMQFSGCVRQIDGHGESQCGQSRFDHPDNGFEARASSDFTSANFKSCCLNVDRYNLTISSDRCRQLMNVVLVTNPSKLLYGDNFHIF
ncbi:hypothetical protein QUB63_12100 [Microcoleus sp. ARI1-B5]|uniref:hypothetical protein n=1 Tax=unclassified Microcoleus TaxID=2642155 RepID=UPI002FD0D0D6